MTIPLRIFISSPSDVNAERAAAARVIDRLAREFGAFFAIQAELWEQEPLRATAHFQEQIPRPSEADLVLVIVWSRLGTRLPADRYKGVISGAVVTGTEWEFEDAAGSFREHGTPDLLFYRKTARLDVTLDDEARVKERLEEKQKLDDFLHKWFFTETAEFKAAFSQFATTHEFELVVEQHLRRLIQRRVDALDDSAADAAPARWRGGSPFRGLEPFDVEHAGIFYGRGRARMELREALTQRAGQGTAFVLLLGMSGSGKSSLVRAALIPDLAVPGVVEKVGLFRHGILRPSDSPEDPLVALANALVSDTALPELVTLGWSAERLLAQLRSDPQKVLPAIEAALNKAGDMEGLLEGAKARVILAIDQLEELYTTSALSADARNRFVDVVQMLVSNPGVWVVATMRSDMFHHLAATPALAQLAEGAGQYHLLPPQPAEISQMIREPAAAAGLRFEIDPATNVGLDETLHQAMEDDPAALPLLEFTLDELFHTRTPRGLLTYQAYNRLGGLEGALAQRAEDVFAALPPDTQAAFPAFAIALGVPQTNAQGFAARRAPMSEFETDPARMALVDAFVQARLFVTDSGDTAVATVRVAHEALLRSWPRLREVLERNVRFIETRERLQVAADRWMQEGKPPDLLLQEGRMLGEAQEVMQTHARELNAGILEFLGASLDAGHKRHRRVLRITQGVAAGFGVIAIIAGITGWFAWQSRIAANAARIEAVGERNTAQKSESFFLAALSNKSTRANDPVSGVLLARAALPKDAAHPDRPVIADATNALNFALAELGAMRGVIRHSSPAVGVFLNDNTIATVGDRDPLRLSRAPDGKLIGQIGTKPPTNSQAWVGDDRRRIILLGQESLDFYDLATRKKGASIDLTERGDSAITIVMNSTLTRAAVFYATGKARLLSLPDGRQLAMLGTGERVYGAGFAAKSSLLWWSDLAGRLVVENTDHPGKPVVFGGGGAKAVSFSVSISPATGLIAASATDGIARIWRLSAPAAPIAVLPATRVVNVHFSQDGNRLATLSGDGMANIWNPATGKLVSSLKGISWRSGITFSPDAKRVAVADTSFAIRIHDTETGASLAFLKGHTAMVRSLGFSPNGKLLLSTSTDGTARIWQPGPSITAPMVALDGDPISLIGYSANSTLYAAAQSGAMMVWRNGPTQPPESFATGASFLHMVAADPQMNVLTTAAMNNAQIWSLHRGVQPVKPVATIPDTGIVVTGLTVSPDGSRVFMTGTAGVASLADAKTGAVIARYKVNAPAVVGGMSHDGSLVWIRSATHLWLRDGRTLAPRVAIDAKVAPTHVMIARDNSTVFATLADGNAALWDAKTGRKLQSLSLPGGEKLAVAGSLTADRMVTIDAKQHAVAIDTAHARVLGEGTLPVRIEQYAALQLSPDGKVFAAPCADGSIRTWSVPTFQPVLEIPPGWIGARGTPPLAFSPDGKYLATRWHDMQLRLWPVDASVASLITRSDREVPRALTAEERRLLILSYN